MSSNKIVGEPLNSPISDGLTVQYLASDPELVAYGNSYAMLIPRYFSPKTKHAIRCAIDAEILGYASIDRLRKVHPLNLSETEKNTSSRILIQQEMMILSLRACHWINGPGHSDPPRFANFIAYIALWRLQSTFRSLNILLEFRYHIEAAGVLRLALEQISWAYSVLFFDDKDKVFNFKAESGIGRLKELISYSGRLYGVLSRFVHIRNDIHMSVVEVVDSKGIVKFSSEEGSIQVAWYALLVADILNIICEIVGYEFINLPNNPSIKILDGNKIKILSERPGLQAISRIKTQLIERREWPFDDDDFGLGA